MADHAQRKPPHAKATETPSPPERESRRQSGTSPVVHRNIAAIMEFRRRDEHRKTISERLADHITAFVGSTWSVWTHVLLFGFWIIANLGWIPGVKPWDPFPFVMLAAFASVEAIFLSTFILISQNRMSRAADRRAELDLQISLLSEYELTRVLQMLDEMSGYLGISRPPSQEMDEIKQETSPMKVAEEIERAETGSSAADRPAGGDEPDNAGDPGERKR